MSTERPDEDRAVEAIRLPEAQIPSPVDMRTHSVVTAVQGTLSELTPQQKTRTILKANFDKHASKFPEIQWAEVEASLDKEPAKLAKLQKLIDRGGEPTVTEKLPNKKFRFDELSEESPKEPRNLTWKQAFEYVKTLGDGVQLMNKDVYVSFWNRGIAMPLDKNSYSWLNDEFKTADIQGRPPIGHHGIPRNGFTNDSDGYTGLRCSLEV